MTGKNRPRYRAILAEISIEIYIPGKSPRVPKPPLSSSQQPPCLKTREKPGRPSSSLLVLFPVSAAVLRNRKNDSCHGFAQANVHPASVFSLHRSLFSVHSPAAAAPIILPRTNEKIQL